MLQRLKLAVNELLVNPNARAILILTTLAIAALAGGAPYDGSGG
jgi:hypothetical protein